MKKIFTILIATLLIGTTAFAQESEMTVEKGQYLEIGNAEENEIVNIHNEQDQLIWEDVEVTTINGIANIIIPLDNPLSIVYVHIIKDDEEDILKVNLTEPHEHQVHHVDFIRPTDSESGRMEYFYCSDCGKYFEDRACTIEITEDINTWSYLAPVPREQWEEGSPAPYIPKYDDKQVTDNSKPNPSWKQEKVEEYYEQEEVEIQEELEERILEPELVVESNEENETIEPVTFAVEPVKVEKELTFWEKIKEFFINLFS